MRLVLVRHAAAVERRRGAPDAGRALTPRGRARFRAEVLGLRRLGLRFDAVLTSPKLRAVQTAELLAPLADGTPRTIVHLARIPAAPLLAEIRGASVAVVGHEPWLSELAAWLTTGNRRLGAKFRMKKGGVIVLEGEPRPGTMRLVAALPPKVLRRAGKA
jgi:phosphohistidine phosphatase